jgi:hypothetical protein
MNLFPHARVNCLLALCALVSSSRAAAPEPAERMRDYSHAMLTNNIDRPLRYSPVGTDFVITNGAEFFNRPLYGGNTAFRVDAGDKPEFSLYLPGRGGNLRLGIKTSAGVKWLNDARQIVARYRPGSMIYEIHDPLLGSRELSLAVLPLPGGNGLILRAGLDAAGPPAELIWAFGGANGMKGQRSGDIGCEREPVARFFQMRPEQCRGNEFSIATNTFLLRSKIATMAGVASATATHSVADANQWDRSDALLASAGTTNILPVVVGRSELLPGQPVYLALQTAGEDGKIFSAGELPELFLKTEAARRTLAGQVVVETPDPFINVAAAALNVAANAIWDAKQKAFMHGAVAWRQRLLGWRGPYAGDELGWHERTAEHFAGFAKQQNTDAIPDVIPAPEASANLSRNENALHSNGNLTKAHYDMNLVGVDAFFRHLLWTGDLDYAQTLWPVIERHLAWERRLFRREFGPDKLPLYEGYACIWASDDLSYNGGGATHSSAYNYFANKMAARVAKLIGKDPTPYEREAGLIGQAMQKYLWLPAEGNFAESKDYLGRQQTHPNAGLWTFYHAIDSEVPTPEQSWRMTCWVDTHIVHIPIRGNNVPDENLFTLPETSWLPYQWSLNNVVVAEAMHTSLAFWQANRPDAAFALFKGALLDTMFLGLCPGNIGAMTSHDMARGEAQRDFGDGIGMTARALVEGLFGVKPDALTGELKIVPGFPDSWDFAKIHHPDFNFEFRRNGLTETFLIEPKFPVPIKLNLQVCALRTADDVTIDGKPATGNWVEGLFGQPRLQITCPAAGRHEVVVNWKGEIPQVKMPPAIAAPVPEKIEALDWEQKYSAAKKFEMVRLTSIFNDRVTRIFQNEYRTPRSPFASLALPKQGIGSWCHPQDSFTVDDTGLRAAAAGAGEKIVLPNGVPLATPGTADANNIAFVSQWDNYPRELSVPLTGKSAHAFLLMAGSTSAMQSRFDNGEMIVTYADGSTARLALHNPTTWWPIEQDYYLDDFAFARPEPLPPRVDLKTGKIRILKMDDFKGTGRAVPGGAATVLDLPLDGTKELKSLTVRSLANEVVIGLMSVTLQR